MRLALAAHGDLVLPDILCLLRDEITDLRRLWSLLARENVKERGELAM
jgi:hypothetical protein